jgi:hypothetical protein
MDHIPTSNFGELYRAAFAERNPERKCTLLGEVQRVIKSWEESEEANLVAPLKIEAKSASLVERRVA